MLNWSISVSSYAVLSQNFELPTIPSIYVTYYLKIIFFSNKKHDLSSSYATTNNSNNSSNNTVCTSIFLSNNNGTPGAVFWLKLFKYFPDSFIFLHFFNFRAKSMPIECRPTKLIKGYYSKLLGKITAWFEVKFKNQF